MSAAGGGARRDGWRRPERNELLRGVLVGRYGTDPLESRPYAAICSRVQERARFAARREEGAEGSAPGAYNDYFLAMERFAAAIRGRDLEDAALAAEDATRAAELLDPDALGEALAWDCRAESAAARSRCTARPEEAASLLTQAEAWAESGSGDPAVLAALRLAEARLHRIESRLWRAVTAFGHAFAYAAVVGEPAQQAEALIGQAEVLAGLGETLYAEEAAVLAVLALELGVQPELELAALEVLSELGSKEGE